MLELKQLRLRNFWSYGDYDTTVSLDDLGPCLITGYSIKSNSDTIFGTEQNSNGAGKSAIVQAMLWCLFGRTMRIPNPGDKVINWHNKKDCVVELEFKNGDILRRTRKLDGHSDLLLVKDGEDVSLGTTTMEQRRLDKLLDLDWDTFCGSTFFAQFGKSWMELSDSKRKDALEREFHMDKIQLYAEVAKEQVDKAKGKQSGLNAKIGALESTGSSIKEDIDRLREASEQFDDNKKARICTLNKGLGVLTEAAKAVKPPNLEALQRKWGIYREIYKRLDGKQQQLIELVQKRAQLEGSVRHERILIKRWEEKGELCDECEQPIPASYISTKTKDPNEKLLKYTASRLDLSSQIDTERAKIDEVKQAVEAKKPRTSESEAKSAIRELARINSQVEAQRETIAEAQGEQNHYAEMIDTSLVKLKKNSGEISALRKKVAKIDQLLLHLSYIYRAYHDRRRIKSYMLAEYIPYLNERIKYYLEKFGLDVIIEFTNALGLKSDKWGYTSLSGGECKRFDVAMMLAMFDLHILMYGRYCNVVVFDEVDGRLDVSGAEVFTDIIRDEFSAKVDTVLVISQRIDMRGSLSSEIRVCKEDGYSKIMEVLK